MGPIQENRKNSVFLFEKMHRHKTKVSEMFLFREKSLHLHREAYAVLLDSEGACEHLHCRRPLSLPVVTDCLKGMPRRQGFIEERLLPHRVHRLLTACEAHSLCTAVFTVL